MLKALLLSFRCPHLVLPSFMVTCLKVFPSCYLLTSDSYWVFTEFCCSKEGPSHPPPIVHAYFYRVFHRVTPLCFRLLCWPLSFNEASTAVTELPGYRVFFFYRVIPGRRRYSWSWLPSPSFIPSCTGFHRVLSGRGHVHFTSFVTSSHRSDVLHSPAHRFSWLLFLFLQNKNPVKRTRIPTFFDWERSRFLFNRIEWVRSNSFFFLFQRKYFQSLVNVSVLNEFLACCGSCCLIDQ